MSVSVPITHRYNGYEYLEEASFVQEIYTKDRNDIKLKIVGYMSSYKTSLFHIIAILLLGLPYIIFNSVSKLKPFKYKRCTLENATRLFVSDDQGNSDLLMVQKEDWIRYFIYQHTKYIWVASEKIFCPVYELNSTLTVDDHLNDSNGLTDDIHKIRLKIYGPNKIEIEVKSYCKLFIEEVLNPFYGFQAFSVILWTIDEYLSYAVCVVILTLFSSITSILQIRKQSQALHDLVETSKCHEVTVLRQRASSTSQIKIDPTELVPGDLIILPPANFIMPCDTVLLTGQCIVNESVLTGESVSITKTALHSGSEIYNPELHKRHTLFSGTHVIQTRFYGGEPVLARVVRTGFETTKGALVKSILYPSPIALAFHKDSFKFVFALFTVAASGMVYCLYLYISRHATLENVIIRTLDVITIVVPPALPAAMTIGTVYSQNRLRKLGIFCISPPRINVCGKIKLACFDKTGTLTHDCLNMNSVIPCINKRFSNPIRDICELDIRSELVQAMATCHSLTRIDGVLNGDPLDLNMFEFTKWELEEPGEDENARFDMLGPTVVKPSKNCAKKLLESSFKELTYEMGIIRQFSFSSTLQCMSIICRELENPDLIAFTKGAPEKIQKMCFPETVPVDFNSRLAEYTAKGYRVIAIAYKKLPEKFKWKDAQKAKRDLIECDLILLGFLIMQNPLKQETAPVIKTLHKTNLRTVMITGDNILTAVSVAYDCGMVKIHDDVCIISTENDDCEMNTGSKFIVEKAGRNQHNDISINFSSDHFHFALDGKTWEKLKHYHPDAIPHLLVKTTIFARFQPDQKTELIKYFQNLDYIVAMVGDGANDCGALKAAHVGVSLSQAEASVAAPFTSSIQNISCLISLMLEGRCALITSFAIFKYMALYSLIQFFTVLILYRQHSTLGDYQFLFIDLIITTAMAVTIGRQGPARHLCAKRPISSLVSAKNLIPLIFQIAICGFIQVASLYYLYQQKWFTPIPVDTVEPVIISWENLVLFCVSCYQYIILAVVYSKGKPYRQSCITNFWLIVSSISLTIFITWLMTYPCKKAAEIMDLIYVNVHQHREFYFKFSLLVFPIVHLLLAIFIEMGIADRKWFKNFIQVIRQKKTPKNKYKLLLQRDYHFPWLSISDI